MKKKLPTILIFAGAGMPILGPILMLLGTDIYLQQTGYVGATDGPYMVAIMRGIYFGIMLGIILIVIAKILKIKSKKKY